MYSRELIHEIHTRLAVNLPRARMLFGGSYWYGEASEESDLDFYCVCPLAQVRRAASAIRTIVAAYARVRLGVMVVPEYFYRRGWYYVAGTDEQREVFTSPLNRTAIIRTALKLAYFHYLKFLVTELPVQKQASATKAALQLTVVWCLLHNQPPSPLFSKVAVRRLLEQSEIPERAALLEFLSGGSSFIDFPDLKIKFVYLLDSAAEKAAPCFRWWWPNYLVYNAKFVREGSGLFLFKNPDRVILDGLKQAIRQDAPGREILQWFTRTVFPVIII